MEQIDMTQYEWISCVLAVCTIILAVISIVIAIVSSRRNAKDIQQITHRLNMSIQAHLLAEIDKIEIDKYRIVQDEVKLDSENAALLSNPKDLDTPCLFGPNGRKRLKQIMEQKESYDNLYKKMSFVQSDMRKIAKSIKD